MGNFSLSEILVIALVILVVFGPERLPEMSRKAGELVRKGRTMISDLRREFDAEWGDVAQPLKDVRDEVRGVKADLDSSMTALNEDIAKAKRELEAQVAETKKDIEAQLPGVEADADEVDKTAADEADEVDKTDTDEVDE